MYGEDPPGSSPSNPIDIGEIILITPGGSSIYYTWWQIENFYNFGGGDNSGNGRSYYGGGSGGSTTNTTSPGSNPLSWMGIRNMDNFQASESLLADAIENTKVGQSTAAAENFMFLELPAQFAGGALLSAGWRAMGIGKYLSGVAGNLYGRIAPGFVGNLAEKTTFSVYHGFDAAGKLRYVGITSRDPAIRWAEHVAAGGEKGLLS